MKRASRHFSVRVSHNIEQHRRLRIWPRSQARMSLMRLLADGMYRARGRDAP